MRLIDADSFENAVSAHRSAYLHKEDVIAAIANQKTVNAVEVVRCKDCIYWDYETGWCNNHSAFDDHDMDWNIYNDDDFCSTGERRTDG